MEEQVGATRSLQPTGVGLATNTEAGSGGTAPQASGNRSTVGVEGALTGQDAGCSPSQFFSPQGNRNTTDNGAGQRAPGQSSQGAAQPVGQVSAAGPGSGSPGRILPRPGVAAHLTDGVHLNEVGMDLFNITIQEAIEMAWKSWRRMQS
eukprot:XP_012818907.1 PREDICTED: uncharacterized protein LOC100487960 isoform X3 [Xenopus tropicalis]